MKHWAEGEEETTDSDWEEKEEKRSSPEFADLRAKEGRVKSSTRWKTQPFVGRQGEGTGLPTELKPLLSRVTFAFF